MLLKNLINGLCEDLESCQDFLDCEISSLCSDSRDVIRGSLFIALRGINGQGDNYIEQAIKRGASAVVINKKSKMQDKCKGICQIRVNDTKQFLGELCRRYYKNPSENLRIVGVTGTNGKTTVTYLLEAIMKAGGKLAGIIGTVNHHFNGKVVEAKNTTPGIIENFRLHQAMVDAHLDYCFMEVSSHALDQGRILGIDFIGAVFTNLTQDHLDYHLSYDEYFSAKKKLFSGLKKDTSAVINNDDPYGEKLLSLNHLNFMTYGINKKSDIMAEDISLELTSSRFTLHYKEQSVEILTPLVGMHNVYNILAAAGQCLIEGISLEDIKMGCENFKGVPGRMESIDEGQNFHVFIDYAHTDDALKNVLESLKDIAKKRIIVVFGCGGNRDKGKRFKMGRVASEFADLSILTNDNPRQEDPEEIINDIKKGFSSDNVRIIIDRKQAIGEGIKMAQEGDVLLIAGKGHEDYQIIKNETLPFNENKIVRDTLKLCFKSEKSRR